jgi:general stress protein CsbA
VRSPLSLAALKRPNATVATCAAAHVATVLAAAPIAATQLLNFATHIMLVVTMDAIALADGYTL